eukprot:10655116-Prorocentrum_lima.AAC.1
MGHMYEEEGSTMFGIAKYPIGQWVEAGEPMITTKGWIKLFYGDSCNILDQPEQGDDHVPEAGGRTLAYSGVSQ